MMFIPLTVAGWRRFIWRLCVLFGVGLSFEAIQDLFLGGQERGWEFPQIVFTIPMLIVVLVLLVRWLLWWKW